MSRVDLQRALESQGHPFHMTTLRRIETGEQIPKLDDAIRIASALGMTVEQLVTDYGENATHINAMNALVGQYEATAKQTIEQLAKWITALEAALCAVAEAIDAGVSASLIREALGIIGRTDDLDGLLIATGWGGDDLDTGPLYDRLMKRERETMARTLSGE